MIVEFRHTLGLIFDKDRKTITLEEELKIFDDELQHIRAIFPYF